MKKLGKKGAVTGGDGETQRWIDERYPEDQVQVQVQRMPWNLDCNGPASQPAQRAQIAQRALRERSIVN